MDAVGYGCTMEKVLSWRALAALLAHRLADAYCEQHRGAYTADCPYCEDVRAWDTWAAKSGAVRPVLPGTPIPLPDILPSGTMRLGGKDY